MGNFTHVLDSFLKDPMGRGIGDHAGGQSIFVQLGLGTEIGDVDIAIGIRSNHNNLMANHLCGGWVGSMGGCGDQADIAMRLPIGCVVFADGQQAGIFTLRA